MSTRTLEQQKTLGPQLGTARIAFKNILLATDFSPGARVALRAAIPIANYFVGRLFLLHAVPPVLYSMEAGTISSEFLEANANAAKERLESLVQAEPELKHIQHTEIVTSVPIIDAINEAVANHHIDLIVTGTHGASGIEKLALGSVSEVVLRHSHAPVMVVGPKTALSQVPFRSILLATDLEIGCQRSAHYAAAIAAESNAELAVVNVLSSKGHSTGEPGRLIAGALDQLKQLLPPDAELWCRPNLRVEFGDTSAQILKVAKNKAADLIVVCAHRNAPLADHAPWSSISKIIRGAACPVLAVPAHV